MPNEIPQEGCKVLVLGKDKRGREKRKLLHVSPAQRCQDWLRFESSDDGHQTLLVAGLTKLVMDLGFDSLEVQHDLPEPAPKPEEGKPLPVAVKSRPEPKAEPKAEPEPEPTEPAEQ